MLTPDELNQEDIDFINNKLIDLTKDAIDSSIQTIEVPINLKIPSHLYDIVVYVSTKSGLNTQVLLEDIVLSSLKDGVEKIKKSLTPQPKVDLKTFAEMFNSGQKSESSGMNSLLTQMDQLDSVMEKFAKLTETVKEMEAKLTTNEKK
jgi:hypothetical protein